MLAYAFRGERNWSQGILDFMGHTARDFTPRGFLLRFQQLAEIFKHHNVAQLLLSMLHGGNSNRSTDAAFVRSNLELGRRHGHTARFARPMLQVFSDFRRKYFPYGRSYQRRSTLRPEHSSQSDIGVGN